MAGFDDLVTAALPYTATENIPATAGTTWQWDYGPIRDASGTLIDMTSGYTGACGIVDSTGFASVIGTAPVVTFPASGYIRCKVTPAVSATVAIGSYLHEVTVTRTSDSAKVNIVGSGDSKFIVKRKLI